MNDSTTLAQIAQQALEMGQLAVTEIVTMVKDMAPKVWEMMIRQVRVEAMVDCGISLVFLAISLPLFVWVYRAARKNGWRDDNYIFGFTASAILFGSSTTSTIVTSRTLILVFNNSEYYAVKNLLAVAAGGGL